MNVATYNLQLQSTLQSFFEPVQAEKLAWCHVVTQTVPISLYMDICIFNFKVRPQCLWSLRLNIVSFSSAVSSFSFLSERQVDQRGGGGKEGEHPVLNKSFLDF